MSQAATGSATATSSDVRFRSTPLPPKSTRHFWLSWGLASALGAGVGFACGLVCAIITSMFLFAATGSPLINDHTVLVYVVVGSLAGGLAGLLIGASVSFGQSMALPWPPAARARWRRWSLVAWTVGAALGLPLAVAVLYVGNDAAGLFDDRRNMPLVELTAAFIGLAVGFGTHRALPRPAPSPPLWVAGTVVATSLGWLLARPFDPGFLELGLSWTGVALGPLVYAIVSGGLMVWAERVRLQAADTHA